MKSIVESVIPKTSQAWSKYCSSFEGDDFKDGFDGEEGTQRFWKWCESIDSSWPWQAFIATARKSCNFAKNVAKTCWEMFRQVMLYWLQGDDRWQTPAIQTTMMVTVVLMNPTKPAMFCLIVHVAKTCGLSICNVIDGVGELCIYALDKGTNVVSQILQYLKNVMSSAQEGIEAVSGLDVWRLSSNHILSFWESNCDNMGPQWAMFSMALSTF